MKTSKTGWNVSFKDILTLENPGNNLNFNFYKMYDLCIVVIAKLG